MDQNQKLLNSAGATVLSNNNEAETRVTIEYPLLYFFPQRQNYLSGTGYEKHPNRCMKIKKK